MQLTPSQKKAVEYNKGPLLIIAGAGTGKTTVLVEKIKYILQKKLAEPDEILALTFTDKAAREMEDRVDKALPIGFFQMYIATFHSFCDRILRDEAANIGLSPAYKLHTTAQQVFFLKNNLFLFDLKYFRPLGNPNKFIEGLLQHFSRLRDEDIEPTNYIKWVKKQSGQSRHSGEPSDSEGDSRISSSSEKSDSGQARMTEIEKYLELAHAYKKFQRLKIRENTMDFADLIYYTLKLFRDRPNILANYRKKFKYILVDEFQDTNIAQYELIKLLAPPKAKPHLTVIGDDNQSIYKFRGASVSNILQFMDDYPTAEKVMLLENFRSNQKILDAAYRLIKHNDPDTLEAKLKISKNLKSARGRGESDSIVFNNTDRVENEAEYITTQIKQLKPKYDWRDFAILVRANKHADAFARTFSRLGIPYQFLGPGTLFKQPEVKELIAYLNVLNDINDSASLFRVLSMDYFTIDQRDLASLLSFTRKTSLSLFEAMEIYLSFFYPELYKPEHANYQKYLFLTTPETKEKLFKIMQLIIKALSKSNKETAGQLLYYFLEDSGMLADLMNHTTEKQERVAQNISKFFDRLKTFEMQEEDASVSAVVDYLTMSMELGESPIAQNIDLSEYDAVNILTVHASKGLEFPVVFLVNLTTDRFPTRLRTEQIPIPRELIKEILPQGNYHIEEERRLFYVGVTRTKDYLFFTASNFYGEGRRERKLSPFVVEALGEDAVLKVKNKVSEEKAQLSIFDFKTVDAVIAKEKVDVNQFSYSQIDTYKTCPLRYKYQYVLRIPTSPNSAASFGDSIHQALHRFYSLVKSGEKPDLDSLLQILKEAWVPIGYKSKVHEDRMKIEGQTFLKRFYETFHNKGVQIVDLEKWFRIKIGADIFVNGKIDRVDIHTGDKIEIIDYKTGKMPEKKDLDNNLQLSLYALAASDPALYGKQVDDIVLTFYFLAENKKVSLTRNQDDLKQVAEKVEEIAENIREGNFEPHVGPWCGFCPFKINCEAWQ